AVCTLRPASPMTSTEYTGPLRSTNAWRLGCHITVAPARPCRSTIGDGPGAPNRYTRAVPNAVSTSNRSATGGKAVNADSYAAKYSSRACAETNPPSPTGPPFDDTIGL